MTSPPVEIAPTTRGTVVALELEAVVRLVASYAASDLGRDRLLGREPSIDEAWLASRSNRLEEVARLVEDGRLVPSFESPVGPRLEKLAETGRDLDGADLLVLADLVATVRRSRDRIASADPSCPALAAVVSDLPDLTELTRSITSRLDRRGRVRDDATPELARLHRAVRSQRTEVQSALRATVEDHRDDLAEATMPSRDGRIVLVVPSSTTGRIAGLAHGRSGTGKSVYFEPLDVVEGNNRLQAAQDEVEIERRRVLVELIELAVEHRDEIVAHATVLAVLDEHQACVAFAADVDGRRPEVAAPGDVRLVAARHPLLEPRLADRRAEVLGHAGHRGDVVPLDLELGPDGRVLVVTGPNAGGKTVALKTLGLSCLMAQCGLPILAAAGSRLPAFRRIVAIIGDEQDVLADRSTFSGRLERWREVCDAADDEALVLLDEVGSGTDPEEGEALAGALIERLVAGRALAFVTTHLGALAGEALELAGAGCAAMTVDPASGRPRFLLQPGPPGGSAAIALAERLGLPADLVAAARARLGDAGRDYRARLAEVEQLRDRLARELGEAEALRRRAATRDQELAAAEAALDEERVKVGKRMKAELDEFRRRVRERIERDVNRALSELPRSKRRAVARKASSEALAGAPEGPIQAGEPDGPIEVGGQVRHRGLGWQGELVELDRGWAHVSVGGKKFRCRTEELTGVAVSPPASPRKPRVTTSASSPEIPIELDLIGRRVDEGLDRLDAYLDQALLAGLSEVRVVHGHGTGRLRDAVRQHLRRHPAVRRHRPGGRGEGGDGATVVEVDV